MEQRDLLTDEIEKLAKLLAKILSGLAGIKNGNDFSMGVNKANETLKKEFDLNVADFLETNKETWQTLLHDKNLKTEQLELLADYAFYVGECYLDANHPQAKIYILWGIHLLEIADKQSKTHSALREQKKLKWLEQAKSFESFS